MPPKWVICDHRLNMTLFKWRLTGSEKYLFKQLRLNIRKMGILAANVWHLAQRLNNQADRRYWYDDHLNSNLLGPNITVPLYESSTLSRVNVLWCATHAQPWSQRHGGMESALWFGCHILSSPKLHKKMATILKTLMNKGSTPH